MSTRSLIGAETESGAKMVYVHSDGYPDGHWGKVETLQRLVAKHGVSKVAATLLKTTSGWSSLSDSDREELPAMYQDGRFELVSGFGIRYTLDVIPGKESYTPQGNSEYDTESTTYKADAEYLYLICMDGKTLRWAENSGPWDQLEWHTEPLV